MLVLAPTTSLLDVVDIDGNGQSSETHACNENLTTLTQVFAAADRVCLLV